MLDIYTVENIEFIPVGIWAWLMDDYSDPMIDDSKEKNKDCLILVSMKSLNLTVKMQYLISIHSKVTKGILDIREENRNTILVFQKLYYLAILP